MFDKTGTLTEDGFALLDIATTATGDERAKLLGWLSLVQERSSHPVAKPFAELPRRSRRATSRACVACERCPGCGVEAVIEAGSDTAHRSRSARPEWIASDQPRPDRWRVLDSGTEGVRAHVIHVALDGELAAVAVLAERLRDSSRETLADFRRLGLPVEVLTGDTAERADALGLPAARGADCCPDDKRAAVEAARPPAEAAVRRRRDQRRLGAGLRARRRRAGERHRPRGRSGGRSRCTTATCASCRGRSN